MTQSPAAPQREIDIPESFHRLKRTTILLCSILIVIAVSTPNAATELELALVKLKLSTRLAEFMLWMAAGYYFAGFYLEYRMVRQTHSEAMSDRSQPYHEKIQEVATRIVGSANDTERRGAVVVQRLENTLEQLDLGLQSFRALENVFDPERRAAVVALQDTWPAKPHERERLLSLIKKASTEWELLENLEQLTSYVSSVRQQAAAVTKGLDEFVAGSGDLAKAIRREQRRLEALSPRIYRERRLLLVWWEFRASAALFAIATAATAWPYLIQALSQMRVG